MPHLPDYAVVKAFHLSMLQEAKQVWTAAGRDPKKLRTCFRYGDRFERAPWGTWEARKAHWRRQFAFVLDRSAAPYLPFVDWLEECNEYTATTTWNSADDTRVCLGSVEAAVAVWNEEIRGRRYATHDGATLDVPDIQLVLCNGPVSNWIHRRYFELAIETNNRLGYHPYIKWFRAWIPDVGGVPAHWVTERDPTDWKEHSGLWDVMEQAHGLYPQWAFTEGPVPYQNTANGWRHQNVCGHDLDTLELSYRLWLADASRTRAYHEGRIDTGMWFTSGNVGWEHYQLDAGQLLRLAQACRAVWQPGKGDEMRTLTNAEQARANVLLDELRYIINGTPPPWWETKTPPYQVKAPAGALALYNAPDGTAVRTISDGRTMDVFERQAAWLRVTQAPTTLYWVRASDVTPL